MADTADSHGRSPADIEHGVEGSRRDFLVLTAGALGVLGALCALWPFVDQMNPAADVLALSSTEVDIAPVKVGQRLTVAWRGKPIFIAHMTPQQIKEAEAVKPESLRDPATVAERIKKLPFLVQIGICTHLGCIPLGQKPGDPRGNFGGWFCPCHGSQYDTTGRIRQGPAPLNLFLPPYEYTKPLAIKIG
jgi:ubiquinol-cytochrome c reductase iron-sulfur subunit